MSTPLSEIGSRLEALFSELKGEENAYARAANVNVILIASKSESEKFIEALSIARPSRFFVLSLNEDSPELKVEVSAQCHPVGYVVSEGHYVCSEIVSISGSPKEVPKISGLIRANVISGMPVELVIFGGQKNLGYVRSIVDLSDRIYFSSKDFSFESLEELLSIKIALVDIEWIRLNVWREAVRLGYSELTAAGRGGDIEGILIASPQRVTALLLAGWTISRLGLSVTAVGGGGVECLGSDGERISVEIKESKSSRLSLRMKNGEIDLSETKDTLDLKVKGEGVKESHIPVKIESEVELMKKYLLIGESISNYRDALRVAVEIESLDRRFRQ